MQQEWGQAGGTSEGLPPGEFLVHRRRPRQQTIQYRAVSAALTGADGRVPVKSGVGSILDSPEMPWLSRSQPDRREQEAWRLFIHSFIHSCIHSFTHVCMLSSVCLFCDPMNYSPPGSSVHGIILARTLPSPGDLLDPGSKPASPALAGGFSSTVTPGKPCSFTHLVHI